MGALTAQQNEQYTNAYGIAYTYNLTAPRMEDFATGNGEAIVDRYAELAYQKDPAKTGSWGDFVKKRIAAINAARTAAQAAQTATSAASSVIGSKTVENVPQLVQKAAAVPATVLTTTPTTTPTVAPSNQTAQPKTWKDYLLWIALGGVVAFGAYKMLSGGGKKKRR